MNNTNYYGPGLPTLLTCIFIAAKLWDKIDWSWWWVLSPLWLPISVIIGISLIIAIIVTIKEHY